jgi:SagB-type dehydrogenase family enzyme
MRKVFLILLQCFFMALYAAVAAGEEPAPGKTKEARIKLPEPRHEGALSIEKGLFKRRSARYYTDEPLLFAELSQLLWAAQGITGPQGQRTAPSAGGLYPLDVYVVVGDVNGLDEGVYKYIPQGHELLKIMDGDKRAELSAASYGQDWVREGAAVIVFSGVYERTARKYGDRAERYVQIEVGSAAQNVYLQAVSLHIGTVFVGAFKDDRVKRILNMTEKEHPLGIMPVGKVK